MSRPEPDREYRYVRAFVAAQETFSETALSLANKVDVNVRIVRLALNSLAEDGAIERRLLGQKIEPVYFHYRPNEGSSVRPSPSA